LHGIDWNVTYAVLVSCQLVLKPEHARGMRDPDWNAYTAHMLACMLGGGYMMSL